MTTTPARRDAGADLEQHRPLTPQEAGEKAIGVVLRHYRPVLDKLLARTDVPAETFIAQLGNAFRAQPKLWLAEPATVLGAALRCAQLNMPPNDGTSRTWIIPREDKRANMLTATFQLGYGGVIELARRAVPELVIDGRPVYPGDLFDLDYGRTPPLKHKPAAARKPPKPRGGDAFAWYVRVRWPDGTEQVHMLDREGVEYHRGFSKQPNGEMWSKSYDAAALKSVVLDMRRWLPQSPMLAAAIDADGKVHDVADMERAGEIRHVPEPEQPAGELEQPEQAPPPADDPADAEWVAAARGDQ
jgi:recombination protein RecT